MHSKNLRGVEIKNADKGEVSAIFATFDVIDKDGDVTLRGAFTDGQEVRISAYGHASWQGALPVGKGTIRETADGAVLEGQFFMNTTAGRDTFQVVKELGGQQEWSYGFDVVKESYGDFDGRRVTFLEELRVHEVSPVMVGAGENTRTMSVKSRKGTRESPVEYKRAIRPHKAAATARPWDGAAVVDAIDAEATVDDLRSIFAWSDGDPTQKSSYRFAHHHGVDGPANMRACVLAIGELNGARGDVGLTEQDRKAVYDHLAAHLRDADREPPALRSADGSELRGYEKAFDALAVISGALDDALRVGALRAQKNKRLSPTAVEAFEWWGEDLEAVLSKHHRLMKLLHDTPREAVAEQFARFVHMQQGRAQ